MTPEYPLSSPFRGRFSKPCSRGKVVGQYGPCCMELGGHWRRENTTGSDLKSYITLGLEKGPGGHVGEPTQCLRESRAGGCPAARKRIRDGGEPSVHCPSSPVLGRWTVLATVGPGAGRLCYKTRQSFSHFSCGCLGNDEITYFRSSY